MIIFVIIGVPLAVVGLIALIYSAIRLSNAVDGSYTVPAAIMTASFYFCVAAIPIYFAVLCFGYNISFSSLFSKFGFVFFGGMLVVTLLFFAFFCFFESKRVLGLIMLIIVLAGAGLGTYMVINDPSFLAEEEEEQQEHYSSGSYNKLDDLLNDDPNNWSSDDKEYIDDVLGELWDN